MMLKEKSLRKFHRYLFINSNGKAGKGLLGIREKIGMAIINTRGIAAGKKSVIVGQ